MSPEPRARTPLVLVCAGVLLVAAVADWRWAWLRVCAESLRGGPGLSAISLRALWLLRVWCAFGGVTLGWAAFVLRRGAAGARPAGTPDSAVWAWPAAVAVGLVAWTVPLGFVGDDFLWLETWHRQGLGVLHAVPGSPHYIPLGMVLCNVPHALFGLHALPYRLVTLLLHGATAVLVGRGAAASGLGTRAAACAGVVFASTALAYEPVLWATGQFYLWPGLLVGVVVLVVLQPPEEMPAWAAWVAALCAAAAGFIIEQAAGLTLFLFLWAAVGGGRRCAARARLPLLVCPAVGGAALLLLRTGTQSAGAALVGADQLLANVNQVLGGMVVLNSPAGHMLGGWVGAHPALRWVGAAFALAAVGVCGLRAGGVGRTLLGLWCCLWAPALLFAPQSSRYWYLPAIPAAIGLLRMLRAIELRWAPAGEGRGGRLTTGVTVAWLGLGLVAMGLRLPDWRAADAVARAVEVDVAVAVAATGGATQVVVAGVPDGVGTGLWPAYVFNNGLGEATRLLLQARGSTWSGPVTMLEGPERPWPLAYTAGGGPPLPVVALTVAAQETGTLVLAYDPATRRLRRWKELGD